MATINVSTNSNLSSVTYVAGDEINVLDGVTLTVNSSWGTKKPFRLLATGTGRIHIENTSTTTPILLDFSLLNASPHIRAEQNAVVKIRGNWITTATGTGASNQSLFFVNNVGGVDLDFVTKIQVETASGSNVFQDWLLVPEYVTNGQHNKFGFNAGYETTGTVAVSSGGVVTGTGTNFNVNRVGARMRISGHANDYEISAVNSATSLQLRDIDTSTTSYTGGAISAGASYYIQCGSLIERPMVGNQENGNVLFFNPLTTEVTCGNGTNGNVIPVGARVRIPNIMITSERVSATLSTAITNTAAPASITISATGSSMPSSQGTYALSSSAGSLLLIEGTKSERIYFTSRSSNVFSGLTRGAYGTEAQSSFSTAATVHFIPYSATALGAFSFDLDTSGSIDGEVFMVGLKGVLSMSNPYSVRLVGVGSPRVSVSGCPNDVYIDGLTCLSDSFTISGSAPGGFTLSNCLGNVTIKNILVALNLAHQYTVSSYTSINLQNCPSLLEFSNITAFAFKRNNGAAGSNCRNIYIQQNNSSAVYNNFKTVGGCLFVINMSDATFENIAYCDNTNNTAYVVGTTLSTYIVSASRCVFRGFRTLLGGKPSLANYISLELTCSDCVIHNKSYPAIEAHNKTAAPFSDGAANSVFSHFTFNNARVNNSAAVINGSVLSAKGGVLREIKSDNLNITSSATGVPYKGLQVIDVISGPHRFMSTTSTTGVIPNLSDVQPIAVVTKHLSTTTGNIAVGAFSAQSTLDMYSTTGTPYLDNIGRYYLPNINDSVIVKTTFPLRSVTGFDTSAAWNLRAYVSPNDTLISGYTVEFRMSNWGTPNTGAWTTFTSMTDMQTAFVALVGYDSNVGLDLQVRYTCVSTPSVPYIMQSLFPVTLDATYNPAVHYSKYTVSGIQAGSNVGFTNTSTSALLLNDSTASGTKTFQLDYDFDGTNIPYRLDVRKPGYTFVSTSGTFNQASQSLPINQLQVLNTAGSALYISGLDNSGFTVNHTTQKITVTSNMTTEQLWSKIQDHLCLTANLTRADFFSTSNGSSYTCTYDLEINNCTLSGNGSISMPSKLVTFVGTGAATVPITDSTGTKVNLVISNIVPNSRIQIYNTTDSTEIYNAVVTGTSLSLLQTWTANKNIRIRATYCIGTTAYHPYQTSGVLSSLGLDIALSQTLDTVYNGIGIDGTTVTECSADYPNVQIDINDPDGVTSVQRIYAWYHSIEYTALGIANFFMGLDSTDGANFTVDTSVLDLKLDNRSASPVRIIGGYLSRSDGATVIAASSNSIQMDPSKAYIANADSISNKLDKTLTTAKFLALK